MNTMQLIRVIRKEALSFAEKWGWSSPMACTYCRSRNCSWPLLLEAESFSP